MPPVDNTPCSNGNTVSNNGEVVGNITDCHGDALAAVLWSHGHAYDLNTLIAPSALHLVGADYINGQGEIVGHGALPNGDQRAFLLIRNPSVPLPAAAPFTKTPHVRTARTAPHGPAAASPCRQPWPLGSPCAARSNNWHKSRASHPPASNIRGAPSSRLAPNRVG
jgi:hypothetical protein